MSSGVGEPMEAASRTASFHDISKPSHVRILFHLYRVGACYRHLSFFFQFPTCVPPVDNSLTITPGTGFVSLARYSAIGALHDHRRPATALFHCHTVTSPHNYLSESCLVHLRRIYIFRQHSSYSGCDV